MARDQATVSCAAGDWTQLTNADATSITFQVLRGGPVFIRYTADATKPTEADGILYQVTDGEKTETISDLISLSGADRVWAKPAGSGGAVDVYVDHA